MDISSHIPTVIAVLALILSLRSSVYARRALRMAEVEFLDKRRSLSLYLVQGMRVKTPKGVFASFAITVTNPSTAAETLTRIDLRLFFKGDSNNLCCTIAEPEAVVTAPGAFTPTALKRPLNLPARSCEQGWISFRIPEILVREKVVEKYQICGVTSENTESTIDVYVLTDTLETE